VTICVCTLLPIAGRPSRVPLARVRASPALVRSEIRWRSTFASEAITANRISRTISFSVDSAGSEYEWNATPAAASFCIWATVCTIPSRLSRSSAQHSTIVNEYVDHASGDKGADKRPQFAAMLDQFTPNECANYLRAARYIDSF
jgi:hypothetical protein